MKRLVWLLLAVFCTALAQVQPVESANANMDNCACCRPGMPCHMPGCCPPPATSSRTVGVTLSAQASPKVARETRRIRRVEATFYAHFLSALTVPVGLKATAKAAPAVGVPLYKAHGRFLL